MYRTLGLALAVWAVSVAVTHANERPANHVHGLDVAGETVTIATHDGVFVVTGDGPIQRISADGHRHALAAEPSVWKRPPQSFDIVAVPGRDGRYYAASGLGLMVSNDGGGTWATVYNRSRPVTAVQVSGRTIYAYVPDQGLLQARDPATAFRRVGDPSTGAAITHIAVDAQDPLRIVVADRTGAVSVSRDGGASWTLFKRD